MDKEHIEETSKKNRMGKERREKRKKGGANFLRWLSH